MTFHTGSYFIIVNYAVAKKTVWLAYSFKTDVDFLNQELINRAYEKKLKRKKKPQTKTKKWSLVNSYIPLKNNFTSAIYTT